MKLTKALKQKNKLVGEIKKLQELIHVENVYEDTNPSKFDIKEHYELLKKKQEELFNLKALLAKANSDIWVKIFEISELKSRIEFLKSLTTREGLIKEREGFSQGIIERKYIAQLNKVRVELEISNLEADITELQDEIDEYNATHTLGVND